MKILFLWVSTAGSSSRRLVPLVVRGILRTTASEEIRRESITVFYFRVPIYRGCPSTK